MDNRCIGVFDSGLGGLTAVKEIMQILPNERIIYFGDTGRVPYGTRGNETIIRYARGDINFLREFDPKMIVVACGTASTVALPVLKGQYDTKITGVVEAAVYRAVRETKNKKIGVIGTPGTISSGVYEAMIAQYDGSIETISKACPLFVPLVENGHSDTKVAELVVEEYLTELRDFGVDTLILGCTHYPHLAKCIGRFMGEGVSLVDSGKEVADYLKKYLTESDMLGDGNYEGEQYEFYVSDNPDGFSRLGGMFLERRIGTRVKQIDIEKY